MRALLFAASCLAYLSACDRQPSQEELARAAAEKVKIERHNEIVRARQEAAEAEAKRRDERVEEALKRLAALGVTRDDLKAYFYDEIEEEVCDERGCRDQD